MNIRRFFDNVQLRCHLLGFHRIARFFGRFGTPSLPAECIDLHDRPTLEVPVFVPPSARAATGIEDDGPLRVIDFDPTFNNNPGIDVSQDIMFPSSKLDIN